MDKRGKWIIATTLQYAANTIRLVDPGADKFDAEDQDLYKTYWAMMGTYLRLADEIKGAQ